MSNEKDVREALEWAEEMDPIADARLRALAAEVRRLQAENQRIYENGCATASKLQRDVDRLQANQPPAAVPAGWKLVPVELTSEMKQAYVGLCMECLPGASDVWGAMLAAAPPPPVEKPTPAPTRGGES